MLAALIIPRVVRAVNAPARAAKAYLTLLQTGHTDEAYASLCSELRQQATTAADFTAALRAEDDQVGRLQSFRISGSTVEIGGNTGIVDFQARTTKTALAMQARMMRENGQWHWCGSRPQPKSTGITVHFP